MFSLNASPPFDCPIFLAFTTPFINKHFSDELFWYSPNSTPDCSTPAKPYAIELIYENA